MLEYFSETIKANALICNTLTTNFTFIAKD
jgi:hypothetical protein